MIEELTQLFIAIRKEQNRAWQLMATDNPKDFYRGKWSGLVTASNVVFDRIHALQLEEEKAATQ